MTTRARLLAVAAVIILLAAPARGQNPPGAYNSPAQTGGGALGVNVKNSGAVGDGKVFWDGVTNAGNNQLTSATATFTSSDVGHLVWCTNTPSSNTATLWPPGQTTVATFVNSSTITYAGSNAGVKTAMACAVINSADPAAISTAFTACKSTSQTPQSQVAFQSLGCNLYIPAGVYGVSGTLDSFVSTGNEPCVGIIGDGIGKTVLVPTATFTSTANGGGSHLGWFINDRCAAGYLRDFAVEIASTPFASGPNASGAIVFTSSLGLLNNVAVYDQCNTNGAMVYAIDLEGGVNIKLYNPTVINNGNCGGATSNGGLQLNTVSQVNVYSPFLSNTQQNLNVANAPAGTNGAGTVIWGGVIDEGSITKVIASQDVWFEGTTLTGGANCISVDATSSVWMSGGYCGTFGGNTGSGPTVASGGVLRMTQVSVNGVNASNYCYNSVAAGGIADLGGNKCLLSGGATTYKAGSFGLTFPLTADSITQLGGRQQVSGTVPTFAVTGFGTGPTVTVGTGSTDAAGSVLITAGTTPGSSGTFTLTFSTGSGAYGTNPPACVFSLQNGTGSWNALAQEPIVTTPTTTSVIANWANNSVALTAASTYGFIWSCYGK